MHSFALLLCIFFSVFTFATFISAEDIPQEEDVVEEPGTIKCYDGAFVQATGVNTNLQNEKDCDPGSVCLNVEATYSVLVKGFSVIGHVVVGQCIPKYLCKRDFCSSVSQALPQNQPAEVLSCDKSCCKTNLCNKPKEKSPGEIDSSAIQTSPTEVHTKPIQCYSGMKISGSLYNRNEQNIITCNPGYSCYELSLLQTPNVLGTLNQAEITYGGCAASDSCNAITCEQFENFLPSTHDTNILEDCQVTCCNKDYCNGPTDTADLLETTLSSLVPNTTVSVIIGEAIATTASPILNELPTHSAADSINCYSGLKIAGSLFSSNEQKIVPCDHGYVCADISVIQETNVQGITAEGQINYGYCIPLSGCNTVSCDRLKDASFAAPGVTSTLKNCQAKCCEQDLCNDPAATVFSHQTTLPQNIISTSDVPVVSEQAKLSYVPGHEARLQATTGTLKTQDSFTMDEPARSSSLPSNIGTVSIKCFSGLKISGSAYNSDSQQIVTCDPGYVCADISVIHESSFFGVTIKGKINYGYCVPPSGCTLNSCDNLKQIMPATYGKNTLKNCQTKCCEQDLCNDPEATAFLHETTLPPRVMSSPYSSISSEPTESSSSSSINTDAEELPMTTTTKTTTGAPCGFEEYATESPKSLYSPNWPHNYRHSQDCEWRITATKPDYRVQINFNRFVTEYCCDYLSILEDTEEVQRFRGYQSNIPPFISTSNQVVLKFHSDSLLSYAGFQATFVETNTMPTQPTTEPTLTGAPCGFVAQATDVPQPLNSPNWPNNYLPSQFCTWNITASQPGRRIRVDFTSFDTEHCCDILTIVSGSQVELYRGSNLNVTSFVSTTANMLLMFNTDSNESKRGFQATFVETDKYSTTNPQSQATTTETDKYSATTAQSQATTTAPCGFVTQATEVPQPLNSPHWPNQYSANENCMWNITASQPGNRIRIDFISFDTEFCCDTLTIHSESGEEERYRGLNLTISSFISTTSHIWLLFHSDATVTKKGFQATFVETTEYPATTPVPPSTTTAPCGFDAEATEVPQSLYSPNWPKQYKRYQDCNWIIRASTPGNRIQINFISFHTESCCDYLTISSPDGEEVIRLKGSHSNLTPFVSQGSELLLHFHSDGSVVKDGFETTFVEISGSSTEQTTSTPVEAPCGFVAQATDVPQPLNSPHWPNQYLANEDCMWNITASQPGNRIRIDFISFDTEFCCDTLTIHSENGQEESYRGENLKLTPFISTTADVFLIFHSDGTVTKNGFQATFVETTEYPATTHQPQTIATAPCGFEAEATEVPQSLDSPNWPNRYQSYQDCNWRIRTTTPGYRIRINFISFNTESCCDYLKISLPNENEMIRIKGPHEHLSPFLSPGGELLLQFHSDGSFNREGFQTTFFETNETTTVTMATPSHTTAPNNAATSSQDTCGYNVVATNVQQNLTSPDWPDYYPNSQDCTWTITSSQSDQRILITFNWVNTETCCDYVKVYEKDGRQVIRYVGHPSLESNSYVSISNQLRVTFHSDGSVTNQGFHASFQETNETPSFEETTTLTTSTLSETTSTNEICGSSIRRAINTKQTLSSPNYPNEYPSFVNCSWSITASQPGERIRIKFSNFNTEYCCDRLKIFDNGNKTRVMRGNIENPQPYTSSGSHLLVTFSSDGSVSRSGFELNYQAIEATVDEMSSKAEQNSTSINNIGSYVQEIEDIVDFMPSCSLRQALKSMYRCEYIFATPPNGNSQGQCRNTIDHAVRCIGNQFAQCKMGAGRNVLDSLDFPNYNSESILSYLRDILNGSPDSTPVYEVQTFCAHAPRNLSYPNKVANYFGFCERGVLDELLEKTKNFYYSYVVATDRKDICRAFHEFKRWILDTFDSRCDYNIIMPETYSDGMVSFLRSSMRIALDTARTLKSVACQDGSFTSALDGSDTFGSPV